MPKKLLPNLVWVCWVGYCSSESITPYHGQTDNVMTPERRWVMEDVLPEAAGLDITAVIYDYTIWKATEDQVNVTIQNKNANGTGYIFRETDEWLPGSLGGTEIERVVPVIPMNRSNWGDGSLTVDGNGSVTDANVQYSYRVDPCYNPQFDPNCPDYEPPIDLVPEFDYEPYDYSEFLELEETDLELAEAKENEEEEIEDEESEEEKREMRLEAALSAADNSALFATALAQAQMLFAMNLATNMSTYYSANIQGGVYPETTNLVDTELPENRQGLRNGLAQQLLHEEMIDMQYDR